MLITYMSGAEYRAMFGLSAGELANASVLDCCAGGAISPPASTPRCTTATASSRHTPTVSSGIDTERPNAAQRCGGRRRAASCLSDFTAHPGRYIAATLPHLPFADGSFDLVLCSHALFTWSDRLDAAWHRATLDELVRVSRHEVRIYLLVVQGTGRSVDFLDELRSHLHAAGCSTGLSPVPYRFQRDPTCSSSSKPSNVREGLPEHECSCLIPAINRPLR
ncbi:class I SAM-dependent methyltransferase [Streptomyces sp. 6N223]|uniref:class I SAM-dependent methyltransferase n=1 Tax=Streptomyces sp. 6N223 TaxID=3457412 RepID=UPI003FD3A79B